MRLFRGWMMSAGLVLTAAAANAQVPAPLGSPYSTVTDIDAPYVAMPPEAPAPGYGGPPLLPPGEPTLLPPAEVYTVLRENGFSPLGIPHLRGFVYTISAIDPGGDDGRLVIDARNGRIIRFTPAYRMGDNFNGAMAAIYGPVGPPPISAVRGPPRPPASVPHVASRTPSVPTPRAAPPRAGEAKPLAAKPAPEPAQQSAAVQARPADAQPVPQAAAPAAEAKPSSPQIRPTQEMPKVQDLE